MKSIEFTLTVSKCMGCHHCPQDKLGAAYKSDVRVMTIHTFKTILGKLPMDCAVHFSGMSECFLNPLCAEMIKAASDSGRDVHLYTTLSGLTERQVFQLSRSRIKYVRLHVPDATGFKMGVDVWLKRYRMFRASGHYATAMAMSQEVDPLIVSTLAQDGIKVEFPHMLGRAGNVFTPPARPLKGPIRCAALRWHQNICLPSGDVVVCCQDWSLSMPLGNLLTDSYSQVEARANEYAANTNPPDDAACRFCDWAAPL